MYMYTCCSDSGKGVKSLATLMCTVLRRALPKVPLPISSKQNPIEYPLPKCKSKLSAQWNSVLSLHASLSAPQLTGLTGLGRDENQMVPPRLVLINNTCTQLSLTDDVMSSQSTEEPASPGSGSRSQEQPSSVSPVDAYPTHDESDTPHSTEVLSYYDRFFPELKKITKTQSLPQLPTEGEDEHEQCSLREVGVEHRQRDAKQADLHVLSHYHQTLSLVIPTSLSVVEATEDKVGMELTSVREDDSHTCALVQSVLPFVEIPAPQILGHTTRSDPEPLYKRTPSVERLVVTRACTCTYMYMMIVHVQCTCIYIYICHVFLRNMCMYIHCTCVSMLCEIL